MKTNALLKAPPKHRRVNFALTEAEWRELKRQSTDAWVSMGRYARRALRFALISTREAEKKAGKRIPREKL